MAKFQIEIPDESWQIFQSKEEYDRDPFSFEGHAKRSRERGGANYRHNKAPQQFPCLAINVGAQYRADGPDEEIMEYFYDFKEIEAG